MKKLFIAPLLFLFSAVNAQDAISFKIKYLPQRQYKSNVATNVNMELDSAGATHPGNGFPMQFTAASTMDLLIITGKVKPDQWLPVQVSFEKGASKMLINNQEHAMPSNPLMGHKIYAEYSPNGENKIDSIPGISASDPQVKTFAALMDALQKKVQFPDRMLTVGDTFSRHTSIKLPISQLKVNYGLTSLYKLVKIENGKAFFNISLTIKQDFEGEQNQMKMAGAGEDSGSGTMTYNIDENYYEDVSASYSFNFNATANGMSFVAKGTASSSYHVDITHTN